MCENGQNTQNPQSSNKISYLARNLKCKERMKCTL